jgi:hypothetical protein
VVNIEHVRINSTPSKIAALRNRRML